jgi:hypothetical protein
VEIWNHF